MSLSSFPHAQGLYDPANEHDACGVAFLADIAGRVTHETGAALAPRKLGDAFAPSSERREGSVAGPLPKK